MRGKPACIGDFLPHRMNFGIYGAAGNKPDQREEADYAAASQLAEGSDGTAASEHHADAKYHAPYDVDD